MSAEIFVVVILRFFGHCCGYCSGYYVQNVLIWLHINKYCIARIAFYVHVFF